MAVEEGGGMGGTAILPPGGGGSRLRPPDPDTRGLATPPFFVVMFCIKGRTSEEQSPLAYPEKEAESTSLLTPMFSLMVCPSLNPKSNLGRVSAS